MTDNPETGNTTGDTITDESKSVEMLQAMVTDLQKRLSEVNRESAARRHRIKDLEAELAEQSSDARVQELTAANEALQGQVREYNMLEALAAVASKEKIAFADDQARRDALKFALAELGDVKPTETAKITEALKSVIEMRKYLVGVAAPPKINARSGNDETPGQLTPEEIVTRKRQSTSLSL